MKILLTFKTPDVISDSLDEYEHQHGKLGEERIKIIKKLQKRIEFGEYCVLEYDTEKDTLKLLCGD